MYVCMFKRCFEFIFSPCYIVAGAVDAGERVYNSGEMACGLVVIGVVL
jgi:hypothetical protein